MRRSGLSAREAARRLGVTRETLYAYVSRGLVRSEAQEGVRERRYRAEDVEALAARKQHRRDPARAALTALHFGAPILESRLSHIADGRLYYRGRDAGELASTASYEEVAALLWTGDAAAALPDAVPELPRSHPARRLAARLPPLEGFQVVLAAASAFLVRLRRATNRLALDRQPSESSAGPPIGTGTSPSSASAQASSA